MTNKATSVCLITPGHIASTPRLVKAADALHEAGIAVHVVAGRTFPPIDVLDETILRRSRWRCTRVPHHTGMRALARRIARRIARYYIARSPSARALATHALHPGIDELSKVGAQTESQLYIGHGGVAGLAAAHKAAAKTSALYGFDAEDWHPGETDFVCTDHAERACVDILLRHCLPNCSVFTCAAPLIGRAFSDAYGVAPTIILNVFPRSEARTREPHVAIPTAGERARLYWFSQTIGPGRGLEYAVEVLSRMRTPAVLQVRGFAIGGYVESLQHRLSAISPAQQVELLPPAPPDEMVAAAAQAHLGLSLEEATPPNRNLCLTNKIFTYCLAGTPQLLSRTLAQEEFAAELGAAALLCDSQHPANTAREIDNLLNDFERYRLARSHAWRLGQERYCWDIESKKLVDQVRTTFSKRPHR